MDLLIDEELSFSPLKPWKESIRQMVHRVLALPLDGFSLMDVEEVQTEVEFIFTSGSHFVKGFIDLVFSYQEKIYFLDWKSNWLGDKLEHYAQDNLHKAMKKHHYDLQAQIYTEACKRYIRLIDPRPFEEAFGGVYYVFLRGISADTGIYRITLECGAPAPP